MMTWMTTKARAKISAERGVRHVIGLGSDDNRGVQDETVAVADPAALPDDTVEIAALRGAADGGAGSGGGPGPCGDRPYRGPGCRGRRPIP